MDAWCRDNGRKQRHSGRSFVAADQAVAERSLDNSLALAPAFRRFLLQPLLGDVLRRSARYWRTLGMSALLLAGCQGNPRTYKYIEAMNAERRALEDRVYELEYELQTLDEELAQVEEENAELRDELGKKKPSASRSSAPRRLEVDRSGAAPPVDVDLEPPSVDPGAPEEPAMQEPPRESEERPATPSKPGVLSPPPVEKPLQDEPAGEAPSVEPGAPGASTGANEGESPGSTAELPPPRDEGTETSATQRGLRVLPAAATLATDDRTVVRVGIDAGRTGGADFDGRPGDDGVTVVVQPKNAAGQIVLDPGSVSIAVLDPSRAADAARVARWDLDAKQVEDLAEEPAKNRGFKLHFAWPGEPPASNLLRLYVRFTDAEGRRFDSEQEIHLELSAAARNGKPGWRAER